jgi:DNA-binding beta-propeller fold protein YncE
VHGQGRDREHQAELQQERRHLDLRRLNLTVGTFPVGSRPAGLVSDGTHIWVANGADGTVTELNSDGSQARTLDVGNNPDAITWDGPHIWVANADDNTVSELNSS